MRRLIAVILVTALMLSIVSGCRNGVKEDVKFDITDEWQNITETQTFKAEMTETTVIQETQVENSAGDTAKYIAYKFSRTITGCKKTDYEKHYSSEVLKEVYELIPMYFGLTFGCDDYDNWNGTPNAVLNDIYHSMCYWMIDSYDYDSDEVKRANEELSSSAYGHENCEGFYTSVEKINSFLRDIYGPNARAFKAEDFDTYDEIKISEESIFEDYDYSFRFAYLPESDIVRCFARETWGGETEGICVCDVKNSNGDYIVEVVLETYDIYNVKYIMTMSCEPNGNIYIKSVEDFYILPDGVENNLKVISEDVEVKYQKYDSSDWVVVDTLTVGDEVYSSGNIDSDREYMWIVTDECIGRVEKKHLVPIE